MFCPKCGAQNPDGADFCGSCGEQFQQRPAPAAQPAPAPAPAGGGASGGTADIAGKAAGLSPKLIGVIVGAVVLVVLIVLIRLFACSGGTPNLVDLVTKTSSEVAGTVKGYKEMSFLGMKVYTNNEEFVKDLATSGESDIEKLKKYNGSYYFVLGNSNGELTLEDINNGSDPNYAMLAMVVVSDKLTSKDVAERVAGIAPYEKVYATKSSSGDYISGGAKGNGCVSTFTAYEKDGVWDLTVYTYAIDSSSGSYYSSQFDSSYDSYDAANYSDSYRK